MPFSIGAEQHRTCGDARDPRSMIMNGKNLAMQRILFGDMDTCSTLVMKCSLLSYFGHNHADSLDMEQARAEHA
jgi:hypothetical protein